MKIRQIFPNATGIGGEQIEFTVLQATAAGQNLLTGHRVNFYHADGTPSGGCQFSSNPVAAANQQTYLAGQSGAQTMFGLTRDCPFDAGGDPLQAAGGAVCWDNTSIDCVAYGTFNNSLGLPVGTPAPAPPAGMALTRTIARGCPTALDDADDTNNSAADFSITAPNPRNSSSPITEKVCAGTPPPNSNFKCKGKKATLIGSSGKDTIKGTGKRDVIVAFRGNDTVSGLGGNDLLCGNGGADTLKGGKGKDVLVGGAGADKLRGGASGDTLLGQAGRDSCNGGPGSDVEASCGRAVTTAPAPGPVY